MPSASFDTPEHEKDFRRSNGCYRASAQCGPGEVEKPSNLLNGRWRPAPARLRGQQFIVDDSKSVGLGVGLSSRGGPFLLAGMDACRQKPFGRVAMLTRLLEANRWIRPNAEFQLFAAVSIGDIPELRARRRDP
jgi:hypothetical protein